MNAETQPRSGLIIAVEGLDGVGKTTLILALASELDAAVLAMPGLPRPVAHTVLTAVGSDPTAVCLFHAACASALGAKARQIAQGGKTVLIDRYWMSSVAYARARGAVLDLTAVERAINAPDLTLYLLVDEEERRRRLEARGATPVDRETMLPGFRDAVFTEMARTNRGSDFAAPTMIDLTGMRVEEAVQTVLAAVRDHREMEQER